MNDRELATLRSAAEAGDRDAEDELVQGLRRSATLTACATGRGEATPTSRTCSENSPRNERIATSSRG